MGNSTKRIEYKNGQKINNLIYLYDSSKSNCGHRKAMFICSCGNNFESLISTVKSGHTNSCGCYHKKKVKIANTKHGDYLNYLYVTWQNIKKRCYKNDHKEYKNYGGRGIKMFPLWVNSYPLFKAYILDTLGERPEGYSIDRINNDGNYEPNNLRWATAKQQANNKRTNRNYANKRRNNK